MTGLMAEGRIVSWGVSCLLLIVAAAGCAKAPAAPPAPPPPTVRVVELEPADVVDYEYFTGRIDAVDSVEVRARVTGYLMSIGFKPGDEVKKGHVLFQIDQRPYQAEFNRVNSQVQLSRAKLSLAEADVLRAEGLSKSPGAISKQDIDRYLAARGEASAALKSSEAMVDSAKLNLEFTNVTAPIDGRVGRNLLSVGNLVVQDDTMLTTIVSEDPIYAYFDVDERTMLRIKKLDREGQFKEAREIHFGLANEGDQYPHSGKLDFVNNRISASTGTLQLRAVVENPKPKNSSARLLTPGLFVRIRLGIGDARKGLVIPQAALASEQANKYLLVVNDKQMVEQRPVVAGPIQSDGRQLVEPVMVVREELGYRPVHRGEDGQPSIKAGDRIIVGGLQRVRSGAPVETKPYISDE